VLLPKILKGVASSLEIKIGLYTGILGNKEKTTNKRIKSTGKKPLNLNILIFFRDKIIKITKIPKNNKLGRYLKLPGTFMKEGRNLEKSR
jgi:hypothetical protein